MLTDKEKTTDTMSWLAANYNYSLPADRIAQTPCHPRDAARLLYLQGNTLRHQRFYALPTLLPPEATLFLNHSAVLPVRLRLHKPTGRRIEVFLLETESAHTHLCEQLHTHSPLRCRALLRPAKHVPIGSDLYSAHTNGIQLRIKRIDHDIVTLHWTPENSCFEAMLADLGETPLPPYLSRAAQPEDTLNYQCVYRQAAGSVAAPTAGLHFTPKLLHTLTQAGICLQYITLHVGAGTFLPIQHEDLRTHSMHAERISIHAEALQALQHSKCPIAVGTTSLRMLESLYWYGCLLAQNPEARFDIPTFAYKELPHLNAPAALQHVSAYMARREATVLTGRTSLYIIPPYRCQLAKGLITNFHQPNSTLLVLVAALLGTRWREVYEEAIEKQYRFLSYGDACFFLL